ncbi:hypothetical protein GQX73_g8604 [Xylaria multiplex]|uniref:Rhodopsin domain-containing protein n=1 Tax=Xylaria multiplex TaxID=323545 RepID=A0A7C8MKK4_9PEZI|nr:hypothetical protein GQX73_g8604 [Xylaria multiplex]
MDLANTPAGSPPPGEATNFVNPPSRQAVMIAISTVAIVWTTSFVSIRIYSTLRLTRSLGAEDWLCLIATIFSFGYIGIILSLSYVSRHIWDVPVIWFTENYWKYRFAGNTLQALAYFISRLPILLLYLRLFGTKRSFRVAVYIAIAAAAGFYIPSIPLISYFCTPSPGGDWGSLDVFAKCQRLLDWALVQGSGDVALNVYILLLPIPPITRLQLPLNKKLGVLAIFLTGLLYVVSHSRSLHICKQLANRAVICSALGLYYRYQLSFTPDVNWNEGNFISMSVVEINIAIICSCMPAVASFVKHLLRNSTLPSSIRSIFSRFTFHSSSQDSFGKVNYLDPSLVLDRDKHREHFPTEYMELSEGAGPVWAGTDHNASAVCGNCDPDWYQPEGIKKTVTVDVV